MKNPERLLVVLDTNVLLVSISSRSKYHWLLQALLERKYRLAITHEILLEYEEVIGNHWSPQVAINTIRTLMELPNVISIPIYYQLRLITSDKDDNKFTDCAFASNADYIVTHDTDFDILKSIPFPRIPVVSLLEFKEILKAKGLG
jgi:putative PIN family toxin of toxin-antitoxin system